MPLVKGFCQHWPDVPVFFTASTMTGHKIAINQLKHTVAGIGYFPLDFPSNINYYLKMINPRLIVLTETDIWPNFFENHEGKKNTLSAVECTHFRAFLSTL
ncbi:MAG: 3-Deoxy-D-manno-octulosonic-acid transferase (kdotransferase) [Candidatus Methanoperedenaceae archaeon GB50]|nr:MAG: 3-Deoxy-D-manno-octulosonic-acid transferase (kdotransferase) [Candidatus Methanoperedenaceae archaeon GB50]